MTSPATDKRVALAAVAGAHGVQGEVKLKLFGDSIDSLARQPSLTVGGKPMLLKDVRAGNKTAIARFEGVASREAAEALRGSLVEIEPRDRGLVTRPHILEQQGSAADGQARLADKAVDAVAKQLQFDLAPHAMRPGDRGQRNALVGRR